MSSLYRFYLAIEYSAIFFGVPLLFYLGLLPIHIFFVLWGGMAVCLTVLLLDRRFDRGQLWRGQAKRRQLWPILLRFLVMAVLLATAVLLFTPDRLFGIIRRIPLLWLIIMVFYPIVSVYPQGIVWRSFIFHRYRGLLTEPWVRILASAAAFSFMHIVFRNPIAPALTLIGGLLFAWTYERSKSQLLASFEHALYGCFIFTIGWGQFFYHGTPHH